MFSFQFISIWPKQNAAKPLKTQQKVFWELFHKWKTEN